MPARRKPNHLKLLAGSRQPLSAPLVPASLLSSVPLAPPWLPHEATEEWQRIGSQLVASRMLHDGSLPLLAILCAVLAKLQNDISAGAPIQASLLAQVRMLAGDFGLTPASLQKFLPVGTSQPPKENPFERLKAMCEDEIPNFEPRPI